MATKKKYIQHNKQCFACGQEKAPAFLGYDIKTLKTYCLSKCKNKKAIPAVELIPAKNEDLISAIVANYSPEDEKTMMGFMGSVASTRLRPAHILHIMKLSELEGLPSMQAALLNIIEADMESRSMDHVELESFGQDRPEEEEVDYVDLDADLAARKADQEKETVKDETVEPYIQHFAPPAPEPIREGKPLGGNYELEPIKAIINEKPIEQVKEELDQDDNPFEI